MATSWKIDFAAEVVSEVLEGVVSLADVAELTNDDAVLRARIFRALPIELFLSD